MTRLIAFTALALSLSLAVHKVLEVTANATVTVLGVAL